MFFENLINFNQGGNKMKKKLVLVLVSAVIVLIFCKTSFALTNDEIADKALTYIGKTVGSCKEFVRFTVLKNLGYIIGSGYYDCYNPVKNEINEASATRGDIIQISNDVNRDDECNVHTAIILTNFENGFDKSGI